MPRMAVIKEFREFVARGNVIDLAVGVIIGAAFGKIVTSAVDDLIMPPIGISRSYAMPLASRLAFAISSWCKVCSTSAAPDSIGISSRTLP